MPILSPESQNFISIMRKIFNNQLDVRKSSFSPLVNYYYSIDKLDGSSNCLDFSWGIDITSSNDESSFRDCLLSFCNFIALDSISIDHFLVSPWKNFKFLEVILIPQSLEPFDVKCILDLDFISLKKITRDIILFYNFPKNKFFNEFLSSFPN